MAFGGIRPEDFTKGIEDQLGDIVKRQALVVIAGVILLTPVKTGLLKGNWQVGLNEDATGQAPVDPNGTKTYRKGVRIINRFKFRATNSNNYITIVSNIRYSEFVEATFGMVRMTLGRLYR